MNRTVAPFLSLFVFLTATIHTGDNQLVESYAGLCAPESLRGGGRPFVASSVPERQLILEHVGEAIAERQSFTNTVAEHKPDQIVNTVCMMNHEIRTVGQFALSTEHEDFSNLKKEEGAFCHRMLWGGSSILLSALCYSFSRSPQTVHAQLTPTVLKAGAIITAATGVYGMGKMLYGLYCLPAIKKRYDQSKASREWLFNCPDAAHMINDGPEQNQYKEMAKDLGVAEESIKTLYTRQVAPIFSDKPVSKEREFKEWRVIKGEKLPGNAAVRYFMRIKKDWKQVELEDTISFVPEIVGKEKGIFDLNGFVAFADEVQEPTKEFNYFDCTTGYVYSLKPTSDKPCWGYRSRCYFEEKAERFDGRPVYCLENTEKTVYTAEHLLDAVHAYLFCRDGSTMPEKGVRDKSESGVKHKEYSLHPRACGLEFYNPWTIKFTYASNKHYSEHGYEKLVWEEIGAGEYLQDMQQYAYKVREFIREYKPNHFDNTEAYASNEKRYWRAKNTK